MAQLSQITGATRQGAGTAVGQVAPQEQTQGQRIDRNAEKDPAPAEPATDLYAHRYTEYQRGADAHEDDADGPALLSRSCQFGCQQGRDYDQQSAAGGHADTCQKQTGVVRAECGKNVEQCEDQQCRYQQTATFPASGQPGHQRDGHGKGDREEGRQLTGQTYRNPEVAGQWRQNADENAFRHAGSEGGE